MRRTLTQAQTSSPVPYEQTERGHPKWTRVTDQTLLTPTLALRSTQTNFARKASKANSTAGDPIKLGVKLNAVLLDPRPGRDAETTLEDGKQTERTGGGLKNAAIFVADSTGVARRVDLEVS